MNSNTTVVINAAIEGAVKVMVSKMVAAGYSEAEIVAYMRSDDGIRNVLRYGESGLQYMVKGA